MSSVVGSICSEKLGRYPMISVPIPNSRLNLTFIFRKEYTDEEKTYRYMCSKCFQQQRKTHERNIAVFKVKFINDTEVEFTEDPTVTSLHICPYRELGETKKMTVVKKGQSKKAPAVKRNAKIPRASKHKNLIVPRLEDYHGYKAYIFNAEGVLWNSRGLIPGATRFVNELVHLKKRILIVTNNSTKTTTQLLSKMYCLGMYELAQNQDIIVSPLTVMVDYFRKNPKFVQGPIYVIGGQSIAETLDKEFAAKCFGIGPDLMQSSNIPDSVNLRRGVSAVIVGFDVHFSYAKIMKAANYLCNPECGFFIMNEENNFIVDGEDDSLIAPGTGMIAAALRSAVYPREPVVFGRPSETMKEFIESKIEGRRTLMFAEGHGDALKFGADLGAVTCRVEIVGVKEEPEMKNKFIPDYYLPYDAIEGYTNSVFAQ